MKTLVLLFGLLIPASSMAADMTRRQIFTALVALRPGPGCTWSGSTYEEVRCDPAESKPSLAQIEAEVARTEAQKEADLKEAQDLPMKQEKIIKMLEYLKSKGVDIGPDGDSLVSE